MTHSPLWLLPRVLFVLFAGCSTSEKPTEPSIISEVQLTNPIDSTYVADSLAPPVPEMWVESIVRGLRIRFNGQFSETTPDTISGVVDFEGYRIYSSRQNIRGGYGLLASFDLEDYDKWVYVPDSTIGYMLFDCPYSLESLRCLYGDPPEPCADSSFFPRQYTRSNPFIHPAFPDSMFYFEPNDYNCSVPGVDTPIRKVYPDEPDPSTLPIGDITADRFTDDGYFKYYEYECTFGGLYPYQMFWVNVTAFDFGYSPLGIEPSETDYWSGAIGAYPRIR